MLIVLLVVVMICYCQQLIDNVCIGPTIANKSNCIILNQCKPPILPLWLALTGELLGCSVCLVAYSLKGLRPFPVKRFLLP